MKRCWLTPMAVVMVLSLGGCDEDSPSGPDTGTPDGTLTLQHADLHMFPGQEVHVVARDGTGRDVTAEATWMVGDAETARVETGLVSAVLPGVTWIRAEYRGSVDSTRAVVSFPDKAENGVALTVRGVLSGPLELTGSAYWHDRLGSDADQTMFLATPGTFDPETPPGIDFVGNGTQISLSLGSAPATGVQQLESWTVEERGGGGFQLVGSNGVLVWHEDPDDPDRVELYVSVGVVDLELDRVEPPALAGLPNGVLGGRVAFDAAGLEVDLSKGAPTIVGQLGTETVRVFAEFQLALRVIPVGTGTVGVEGGPLPFAVRALGAPQAGRYRDGLILDYSLALPASDGTVASVINQIWIGSPREGVIALDEVGPMAIAGTDAYATNQTWAWSGQDKDVQAAFRGDGANNAFSSGGSVRVTSYRPASDDVYGQIEGEFEIPETIYGPGGVQGEQVVRGTFVAPILPHALAVSQIVPPPEIPTPGTFEPEPWRPRIGNGSARVYGQVAEDDMYGIEGVEVSISGPAGSGTAITNAYGTFSFEGLTPGDYDINMVVPAGHQLARGQTTNVSAIHVEKRDQIRLDLKLADEAGNGTLFILAVDVDTNTPVNGVRIITRPEGGGDPVAILVTGGPFGRALGKLQPGRYILEVEPPAGYNVSSSQPIVIQIDMGHVRAAVVAVTAG